MVVIVFVTMFVVISVELLSYCCNTIICEIDVVFMDIINNVYDMCTSYLEIRGWLFWCVTTKVRKIIKRDSSTEVFK